MRPGQLSIPETFANRSEITQNLDRARTLTESELPTLDEALVIRRELLTRPCVESRIQIERALAEIRRRVPSLDRIGIEDRRCLDLAGLVPGIDTLRAATAAAC